MTCRQSDPRTGFLSCGIKLARKKVCGSSIGEVTEGLTSGYRVYLYTHTGVPVPDLHSGPTYSHSGDGDGGSRAGVDSYGGDIRPG